MKLAALCASLLFGAAACHEGAPSPGEATGSSSGKAEQAKPAAVAVVKAASEPMPTYTVLTGSLIAEQRTQLTAGAAGRVMATRCERGQEVRAHDVLLVLDVRQAQHGAKEAAANLRNMKAQRATSAQDCKRYEALYKKQAISDQEYERMMAQCRELDAQFEAAEARAAEAARSLSDGQVRAPYAGIVSERAVQVGDYVQAASPVVTLLQRNPLRLRAAVPESQAAFVAVGNKVQFKVAAHPEREFTGVVRYVSGEVREQNRDLVFEAVVGDDEHALLPGMFAEGRLYGAPRPLPVVPQKAVLRQNDRAYVYLVKGDHLEKHVVRTGDDSKGGNAVGIAIDEGLAVGDEVVADASLPLTDGQAFERKD